MLLPDLKLNLHSTRRLQPDVSIGLLGTDKYCFHMSEHNLQLFFLNHSRDIAGVSLQVLFTLYFNIPAILSEESFLVSKASVALKL